MRASNVYNEGISEEMRGYFTRIATMVIAVPTRYKNIFMNLATIYR